MYEFLFELYILRCLTIGKKNTYNFTIRVYIIFSVSCQKCVFDNLVTKSFATRLNVILDTHKIYFNLYLIYISSINIYIYIYIKKQKCKGQDSNLACPSLIGLIEPLLLDRSMDFFICIIDKIKFKMSLLRIELRCATNKLKSNVIFYHVIAHLCIHFVLMIYINDVVVIVVHLFPCLILY